MHSGQSVEMNQGWEIKESLPGTVLMSRPGTAMSDTEPSHDEPESVVLQGTPKPAEWRRKAASISCAESAVETEAGEKGAEARRSDSSSLPATKSKRKRGTVHALQLQHTLSENVQLHLEGAGVLAISNVWIEVGAAAVELLVVAPVVKVVASAVVDDDVGASVEVVAVVLVV
jgi:hypothetical protein